MALFQVSLSNNLFHDFPTLNKAALAKTNRWCSRGMCFCWLGDPVQFQGLGSPWNPICLSTCTDVLLLWTMLIWLSFVSTLIQNFQFCLIFHFQIPSKPLHLFCLFFLATHLDIYDRHLTELLMICLLLHNIADMLVWMFIHAIHDISTC